MAPFPLSSLSLFFPLSLTSSLSLSFSLSLSSLSLSLSLLLLLLLPSCLSSPQFSSPQFSISSNGRILDLYGRERIFHGLNVVVKGPPWSPRTDQFDVQMSVAADDVALLSSLGVNVVRLGAMWPGVEPTRGELNRTYLDEIRGIVRSLSAAGIFSLVEMHQDVFSSRFCGEGVPSWLLEPSAAKKPERFGFFEKGDELETDGGIKFFDGRSESDGNHLPADVKLNLNSNSNPNSDSDSDSNSNSDSNSLNEEGDEYSLFPKILPQEYAVTFPEPVARRYPVESENGEIQPSIGLCLSHVWSSYHFSFAVARSYQDLYDNRYGWADAMANYWANTAKTLRDEPGILGYELINEPWVGDQFTDPLLLVPGFADRTNLQPFYDRLHAAIIREDSARLIFFESVTFENVGNGFSHVPGGTEFSNSSVLSFHYYRPPNLGIQQTFVERERESRRLKCGAFLTEFGIPARPSSRMGYKGANDKKLENVRNKGRRNWGFGARLVQKVLRERGRGEEVTEEWLQQVLREREEGKGGTEEEGEREEGKGGKEEEGEREEREKIMEVGQREGRVNVEEESKGERGARGDIEQGGDGEERDESGKGGGRVERGERKWMWGESERETEEVMNAADKHILSWIGWEYKSFVNKTGSNFGPFNNDGTVDVTIAKLLARTFPRAVAGNIREFSFDSETGEFLLSYIAGGKREGEGEGKEEGGAGGEGGVKGKGEGEGEGDLAYVTEIWFHREFYYSTGVEVEVEPVGVEVREEKSLVFLRHDADVAGKQVDVKILPRVTMGRVKANI